MTNFRRMFWFWVLVAGLLGPMIIVALMAAIVPNQGAGATPAQEGAQPAAFRPSGMGEPSIVRNPNAPLYMVGGVQGVWVAIPRSLRQKDSNEDVFELWEHQRNAIEGGREVWRGAAAGPGQRYFWGKVYGMSAVPGKKRDAQTGQSRDILRPYLAVGRNGQYVVKSYAVSGPQSETRFPPLQAPVAVAGGPEAVYVLTQGGERIVTTVPATTAASSGPATSTAPSTAPAVRVVELPARVWNVLAFHDNTLDERELPPLGPVATSDLGNTPTLGSRPALIRVPDELIVAWTEGTDNTRLRVRTLPLRQRSPATSAAAPSSASAPAETRAAASRPVPEWSPMVVSDVKTPLAQRLLGFAVEGQAYVAWAVRKGVGWELDGRAVGRDGSLASVKLFPLDISKISENIADPQADIAVAQFGTAVRVAVLGRDEKLRSITFGTDGVAAGPPQEIEPGASNLAEGVAQNLMLILLVALLAISLWQWRLRPARVVLPAGVRIAPLQRRVLAGLIDLAIPYVAVIVTFGLYNQWSEILQAWLAGLARPADAYAKHPELLWIIGGYVVHVTLGELFTGRSIGKALLGTRVTAMDGRRAGPGAVLIRNMLKIFELGTGVLLIYVLITEHRQRLGDMLARTLVVEVSPEKPSDGGPRSRRDDQIGAGKS